MLHVELYLFSTYIMLIWIKDLPMYFRKGEYGCFVNGVVDWTQA